MIPSRLCWLAALCLVLATADAHADQPARSTTAKSGSVRWGTAQSSDQNNVTCTVYSLAELGDDPGLAKWIAVTIPQVIQPGTWSKDKATGPAAHGRRLSYYAPARILVVYHTPAAQAEVAAFLQNVKRALPQQARIAPAQARTTAPRSQVLVPAAYAAPALLNSSGPGPAAEAAYPVPAPLQHPKHLFHFIIHYDGDGTVDSSAVTGLISNLSGQTADKDDSAGKAKPSAANAAPAHQCFNFIIRYEGEGIIDSTVADVLKEIYGAQAAKEAGASMPPVGCYGSSPTTYGPSRWGVPLTMQAPQSCAPCVPAQSTTGPAAAPQSTTPATGSPAPGPATKP